MAQQNSSTLAEVRGIVTQFRSGQISYWKAHAQLAGRHGIPHKEIACGLHGNDCAPHFVPAQFMKYVSQ